MTHAKGKAGKPYAPGNEAADGSYLVGKFKPPESGKFRKDDGRPRGRRRKGTKNLRTDFEEEMASMVTISVNGKPRRVSRQRSIMMRLTDQASRGEATAIKTTLGLQMRFDEGGAGGTQTNEHNDLEAHLPCLDTLTPEELDQVSMLLHKAMGEPYTPIETCTHPLAYVRDPNDERNYYNQSTVEGLSYRRCTIESVPDEIIGIRNRAYIRAALPRPDSFDRR